MPRQEISAHCLKWSKKCKEAFTSPILAVLHSTFASVGAPSMLVMLTYSSVPLQHVEPAQTYMRPAHSASSAPLIYLQKQKNTLYYFYFSLLFLEWIGSCEVCVQIGLHMTNWAFCSAKLDENHSPPSPRAKLRKYRQAGRRNSVTSYWAPKSVGNPMVQYYSL